MSKILLLLTPTLAFQLLVPTNPKVASSLVQMEESSNEDDAVGSSKGSVTGGSDDSSVASSSSEDDDESHPEPPRPGRRAQAKFKLMVSLFEEWVESMNPENDVTRRREAREKAKVALNNMVMGHYRREQIVSVTENLHDLVEGIYTTKHLWDRVNELNDSLALQGPGFSELGFTPQAHLSALDALSEQIEKEYYDAQNIEYDTYTQIKLDIERQRNINHLFTDLAKMLGQTTLTLEQSRIALRAVGKFMENSKKAFGKL